VRPDYFELAKVSLQDTPVHLIAHRDAIVLEQKSARLGGFDAKVFRRDIPQYLDEMLENT
jgi:hypothetical protein